MRGLVITGLVLAISLGLSLSAGRTILDFLKRRDVVRQRQEELTRLRRENQALEQELTEIQQETYVERIARDKLGLVRDGETIVIVPEAGGKKQSSNAALSHWRQWWKLFF